ncbi:MAG TPA: hypothetical protein DEQ38_03825 [Elusimicrobia bacterium]|nr:MAG: hypothetical protein A2089_13105 [Elusimicrobia bacterium GWD2_63_28]HCC47233.1 hypothetical protein [Elusimicrobiota bacterium]
MKKLRLLFVIENEAYGGGEKGFAQLINGLDPARYEFLAACRAEGPFAEKIRHAARVIPFDMGQRFSLPGFARLRRIIRDEGVDLVHSQGARADLYARLAAAAAGRPSVSTLQMPVEGFDVGPLRKALYVLADKFSSLFCDRVIVVSPALARFALERRPFSADKVRLIYNAPGPEFFDAPAGAGRPAVPGAEGKFLIGAAARLVWQKGFACLIDALALIKAEEPELSSRLLCALAGEGELKEELMERARRAGLSNVVFPGFIQRPAEFLSGLDVFLLPSLREGQPNALLEAMALGKPIIASAIDGVIGTVEDGRDALLVPPGDARALAAAIRKAAADPGLARRLGESARAAARGKFSHGVFISEHDRLYRELAGQERRED